MYHNHRRCQGNCRHTFAMVINRPDGSLTITPTSVITEVSLIVRVVVQLFLISCGREVWNSVTEYSSINESESPKLDST